MQHLNKTPFYNHIEKNNKTLQSGTKKKQFKMLTRAIGLPVLHVLDLLVTDMCL